MGVVTNVYWNCPGCGSRETAQVYGEYDDPTEFPVTAVPVWRGLKWNPPCEKCGKYRLMEPKVFVECKPELVEDQADAQPNPDFSRWVDDGVDKHNGKYYYKCSVCGVSDWIAHYGTMDQLTCKCPAPKP